MNTIFEQYCLDTNVLIEAWRKYYSPEFCPEYWEVLNDFGKQGRIFLPKLVRTEIDRTDDDLAKWLKASNIAVYEMDENVTACLSQIYKANPDHKFLVDNTRQRSLADPWVIAHAMNTGACVVTKENMDTAVNSKRIKIPNVCQNMGIRWINDFELIRELKIKFSCKNCLTSSTPVSGTASAKKNSERMDSGQAKGIAKFLS